jgi:hypothetical protein
MGIEHLGTYKFKPIVDESHQYAIAGEIRGIGPVILQTYATLEELTKAYPEWIEAAEKKGIKEQVLPVRYKLDYEDSFPVIYDIIKDYERNR